jgi:hypothetical protein
MALISPLLSAMKGLDMTKNLHLRARFLVWTAMAGVLMPASAVTAAEPARTTRERQRHAAVLDAALSQSGTLSGKVYNAQGKPLPGVDVVVVAPRGEAVRLLTNEQGEFAAGGLKGGVYHLTAGHGSQLVRAWTEGTAPPAAERQIFIVSDTRVALGQYEPGTLGHFMQEAKYTLSNPLIVGGIIAAAVAIPVAIHNSDDDGPTGS